MNLEYIYRAWRYRLKQDKNEINYLRKTIQKNDTVVDIGAHKGAYIHWMRNCVGSHGKVVAFEPQIQLAHYLKDIYAKKQNVIIEPLALSHTEAEMKLYCVNKGSPGASLNSMHDDKQGTNLEKPFVNVKTTTLSSYVKKNKLDNIRFIKCDVEGHELSVFEGAKEILSYYKPIILFECENRHQKRGQTIIDVFQYLENLSYQGYFFLNKKLIPVKLFNADQYQSNPRDKKNYINNFVFKCL